MNKNSAGFFLADEFYIVPSGESKKFEKSIKKILLENNINLVISVVDEELITLSDLCKQMDIICIQPKKTFINKGN